MNFPSVTEGLSFGNAFQHPTTSAVCTHYGLYPLSGMSRGFVHRCGRTARMGRAGQAVVMLLPSERAYVEFLELNQHVSVQPLPSDSAPDPTITCRARELAAGER